MPNRNVSTEVWNDPKFTDDFTAEDKYFWLFILTTRYGNMSGCFEITPNQIAKDMGYSKETALNLIYRFVHNHKMIAYDNDTNEILIFKWYKYNWSKSPLLEKNIYKFIDEIKSDDLRNTLIEMYENYKSGDRVSIGYQYLTNTNTIPITIPNPISNDFNDLKKDVINYLNKVLSTQYKSTSKKNTDLIKARVNEGYTLDDFKVVIDNMYKLWSQDEKMAQYLRPETLFSNKFESYLNIKKGKSDRWQAIKNMGEF